MHSREKHRPFQFVGHLVYFLLGLCLPASHTDTLFEKITIRFDLRDWYWCNHHLKVEKRWRDNKVKEKRERGSLQALQVRTTEILAMGFVKVQVLWGGCSFCHFAHSKRLHCGLQSMPLSSFGILSRCLEKDVSCWWEQDKKWKGKGLHV